ncbi:matrixin family metalloprotease [Lentilactobacillus sp. Marseille-Q4993]|uniref:matrixin family metalloprotease n=1 Tax=Lentilactobacillus sp. Marseille-Q4993 TaxID=3039492 RepID=UPI0024BCED6D|nr:matrixin family metalloprotease [Lentilactobacillus sp. Marseille-Q4993]
MKAKKIVAPVILGILVTGISGFWFEVKIAKADDIKPTSALLTKGNSFYLQNKQSLADKYLLNYASMNGLDNKGKVYIYDVTKNKELRKSLDLAMDYWNSKLGTKVFLLGTNKHHTIKFSVSNSKVTSTDRSDAWWSPSRKEIQIRSSYFVSAPKRMARLVLQKSIETETARDNRLIDSFRAKNVDTNKLSKYRNDLVKKTEKEIKLQKRVIDKENLDVKARRFEYASTLTHEMGHMLGLNHSPNKNDAMYWANDVPEIYVYSKLKASKNGFNPLTSTDVNRAKLSLQVYKATH